MNINENILSDLKKEILIFIKQNPKFKHLLLDSFNDHKNRYRKDLEIIEQYFKQGKILDLGANPFHITFCLKRLGYDVVGIDINPEFFKSFIDKYGLSIKKVNIEFEKIPFKSNTFDLIIFNEVFEHLRINPIFTLKEINRVLKPGGILLLTTPNLYAIHKILMFNSGRSFNDAYEQFQKIETYGYVGHIREYSTDEIKKFLIKTNFDVEKVIYRNDYSFFTYSGFHNLFLRIIGLFIDLLMVINPYWRRHQAFISKKL